MDISIPDEIFGHISRYTSVITWRMWCMTCVEYAGHRQHPTYKPRRHSPGITEEAAAGGYPELMKFGLELGHPCSKNTIAAAIMSGNDECFRLIPREVFALKHSSGIRAAVAMGRVDLLESIYAQIADGRIKYDELILLAITNKRFEMVKYLHTYANNHGLTGDRNIIFNAARTGNEEILYYVVDNSPMMSTTMYAGIIIGFPPADVMRVIRNVFDMTQIRPHSPALAAAIAMDIPEAIEWCGQYHLHVDYSAAALAAEYGWTSILLGYFPTAVPNVIAFVGYIVASNDHADTLKSLVDSGILAISADIVRTAARSGSLTVLDYLKQYDDIFDVEMICDGAYMCGQLSVIKYLHREGFAVSPPRRFKLTSEIILWLVKHRIYDTTTALCTVARDRRRKPARVIEPDPHKWDDRVYDVIVSLRACPMHDIAIAGGAGHRLDEAVARANYG